MTSRISIIGVKKTSIRGIKTSNKAEIISIIPEINSMSGSKIAKIISRIGSKISIIISSKVTATFMTAPKILTITLMISMRIFKTPSISSITTSIIWTMRPITNCRILASIFAINWVIGIKIAVSISRILVIGSMSFSSSFTTSSNTIMTTSRMPSITSTKTSIIWLITFINKSRIGFNFSMILPTSSTILSINCWTISRTLLSKALKFSFWRSNTAIKAISAAHGPALAAPPTALNASLTVPRTSLNFMNIVIASV